MPVVQRPTGPSVTGAGLPSARLTPIRDTSVENLGRALRESATAFDPLIEQKRALREKAQSEADALAMTRYKTGILKWRADALYNSETGLYNLDSDKAINITQLGTESFAKESARLRAEVGASPRLSAKLALLEEEEKASIYLELTKYEASQRSRAGTDTVNENMDANIEYGRYIYRDPAQVEKGLSDIEKAEQMIRPLWAGAPDSDGALRQLIDQNVREKQVRYKAGIVDQAITNGDYDVAEAWLSDPRWSDIPEKTRNRFEKEIREGRDIQIGEETAVIILKDDDVNDMASFNKKLDDYDLDGLAKSSAKDHAKDAFAEIEKQSRMVQEESHRSLMSMIESNSSMWEIRRTEMWRALDKEGRKSIEEYYRMNARGEEPRVDPVSFMGLLEMAGTDKPAFLKTNIGLYRSKLDNASYAFIEELKSGLANGDPVAMRTAHNAKVIVDASVTVAASLGITRHDNPERFADIQQAIYLEAINGSNNMPNPNQKGAVMATLTRKDIDEAAHRVVVSEWKRSEAESVVPKRFLENLTATLGYEPTPREAMDAWRATRNRREEELRDVISAAVGAR